ncbi:MAG TPA: TetR/AcrR family transcriptional regulator [Thermoleophilia bacterium]|nr:TetR/AcrR family transcriptional regulator [Thermoleophilia bacterium]
MELIEAPAYKTPLQKRSRESLERILEAAEEQIRAEGLESLTIADVVRGAGLSVGAFYSRFPDKTALLHAVQERFHNKIEPLIHQELSAPPEDGETLEGAVNRSIDVLIKYVVGERELSRAFMMSSVFDPILRSRGEQVNQARRETLVSVLMAHSAGIGHPDPVLAIGMAYAMYAAVVREVLMFGAQHELYYNIPSCTIFSELKEALALYLRGGSNVNRWKSPA